MKVTSIITTVGNNSANGCLLSHCDNLTELLLEFAVYPFNSHIMAGSSCKDNS